MGHPVAFPASRGTEADRSVASEKKRAANKDPAAGPHAKPRLTDPEKTPGAGSLPSPDLPSDGDATTG